MSEQTFEKLKPYIRQLRRLCFTDPPGYWQALGRFAEQNGLTRRRVSAEVWRGTREFNLMWPKGYREDLEPKHAR